MEKFEAASPRVKNFLGCFFIFGLLLLAIPIAAYAAPLSVVQTTDAGVSVYATSTTASFSSNVAAGNIIAVQAAGYNSSSSTVTDTCGLSGISDAYSLFSLPSDPFIMAYAVVGQSGNCSITFNTGDTSSHTISLLAYELSGINQNVPLDTSTINFQNYGDYTATDSITSGIATTTWSGDFLFGTTANPQYVGTPVLEAGTGYSLINSVVVNSGPISTSEYMIQGSAGSTAATFTNSSSCSASCQFITGLMAFRPFAFSASSSLIATGGTSILSWNIPGATSASISGIGSISIPTGSVAVNPTSTTIYTLSAATPNGTTTATATVTIDTTPPSIPTGLTGYVMSPTQVDLAWSSSTDNVAVAGYDVYRNGIRIATTSVTAFNDTTLAPSSTIAYTVDAYDTSGNTSAQSTSTGVATPATSAIGPVDIFVPMNAGAPGAALTTSTLFSGTINPSSDWTFFSASNTENLLPSMTIGPYENSTLSPVVQGTTTYPTTIPTQSIVFNHAYAGQTAHIFIPAGYYNMTSAGWITFGPPDSGTGVFDYILMSSVTGGYAVLQLNNGNYHVGGPYYVSIETNPGSVTTHSKPITITPGETYWYSMNTNFGTGLASLALFDTTGSEVGSIVTASLGPVGDQVVSFAFGNNEWATASGSVSYFNNLMVNYTDPTFPLGPGVSATFQSSATSSLSFNVPQGATTITESGVMLKNIGSAGSILNWTATSTASWVVPVYSSGTLLSGATSSFPLTINASGFAAGLYNATITIQGPSPSGIWQAIPVAMNVTAPAGSSVGWGGGSAYDISINGGASSTTNPQVALSLYGTEAYTMAIATDQQSTSSPVWIPYTTSYPWTLPNIPGLHTVAVTYRAISGSIVGTAKASIVFSPSTSISSTTFSVPSVLPSPTTDTLLQELSSLRQAFNILLVEAKIQGIDFPYAPFPLANASSSFIKNLALGDRGSDVKALQEYLNSHGFPVNSTPSHAGSLGYETQYFGPATKHALARLQASVGLPSTGFFGPITRGWVNTH